MKKLTFVFLLCSTFFYAQEYRVLDTAHYKERDALIKSYELIHKEFNKSLKKKYKGKLRGKIEDLYGVTQKRFIKNIKKKRILFDQRYQQYINSLLEKITNHNPSLTDLELRAFISRHNTPNALTIGNGIIIVNVGLFKYLENEDQLASVLSHEIAHETQKHVSKNIVHKASLLISDQKKRQAKEIKRQKYNSYEKAFSVLKDLIYAEGRKHRELEMKADSVGYVLYKKSNFNSGDYVKALGILAELDTLDPFQLKDSIYRKIFDLPEQPFKNQWLNTEEFSQYDYSQYTEKIDKDSLKSHPEIVERIRKLKSNFTELNQQVDVNNSADIKFKELQTIARNEDIANLHYTEKYGLSIYLTLKKLTDDNNNKRLLKWIGKNFEQLYQAKKDYKLNRYVDRIVPDEQDKSYQQFLSFLWNLRLEELKTIADHYNKKAL